MLIWTLSHSDEPVNQIIPFQVFTEFVSKRRFYVLSDDTRCLSGRRSQKALGNRQVCRSLSHN